MCIVLSLALVLSACSTAPMSKDQKEEKRDSVRAMASKTLADLAKKHPDARKAVADGAGYAVFSDIGMKIVYMGTAKGGGIVVRFPGRGQEDPFRARVDRKGASGGTGLQRPGGSDEPRARGAQQGNRRSDPREVNGNPGRRSTEI
jgi:hypothetical protein